MHTLIKVLEMTCHTDDTHTLTQITGEKEDETKQNKGMEKGIAGWTLDGFESWHTTIIRRRSY